MKNINKIDIKTLIFITVIILSISLIFYLTSLLSNNQGESQTQSINQTRVKAESKTYSKTINLNPNSSNQITLTPPATPTTIFLAESPTPVKSPTPELTFSLEKEVSPTPTEIILAYNISTEEEKIKNSTDEITPKSIPESGSIIPLLAIFSVSLFIILFSLIY